MAFFVNLPQQQTVGSALGAGLGQGLQQGVQAGLTGSLDQYFQQRKLQKESDNLQKTLNTLSPEAALTDKFKAIAVAPVSADTKKLYFQSLQQEGAQKFADKLRSGQQMSTADVIEGAALGYIPPGAEVELLRGIGGTREKEQAQKLFGTEYQKVRKEGQEAKNIISTVRNQRKLLDEGKFGTLSFDNLLSKIGLGGMTSPEAQAFQANLINFITGKREQFGVRLTDADLKLIQNKMPDIARTKEGNEAILDLYESDASYREIHQKAYDKVLKEKGFTFDFPAQVEEEENKLLSQRPDVQDLYKSSLDKLNEMSKSSSSKISEFEFEEMPKATPQNVGKVIEDDKGNKYRSTGRSWRKI